jgi:3-oxoacyl-[acyl-carrier-protein] synthase II
LTIAITGVGVVSSIARNAAGFFRAVREGRSGVRPMTAAERQGLQATHVARIDTWTPQPEITPMKARRLDRGSQFAVVASFEALASADFPLAQKREALGIALGTGSAGAGALQEFLRVLLVESPEAAPPFHFPNTIANAPASQVSLEVKFYGPNVTITQKDPSALNALIYAAGCIENGRAQAMLAGGVDEWNSVYSMAMDQLHALRGEKRSSGIVQGEGAFVVLLEAEDAARARGARVIARLAGYAFAGSPAAPYQFVADEAAAERAIGSAIEASGIPAGEIGLAMLSRNGRREMDALESRVLDRLLPRCAERVAIKENVGEMAAAGGASLVYAALRLEQPGAPRAALVDAFGAGGNFLAAVLERP